MPALQSARILDQLRERIRYLHYSLRTEEAYVYWAKAFIRFHKLRHPADMGKPEIDAYLMWLVAKRNVSSSTHRQASPNPSTRAIGSGRPAPAFKTRTSH